MLPNGTFLSGGSGFVALGGGRFLALAHHNIKPSKKREYLHHWLVVAAREGRPGEPHTFALEWVSEAFRWARLVLQLSATRRQLP